MNSRTNNVLYHTFFIIILFISLLYKNTATVQQLVQGANRKIESSMKKLSEWMFQASSQYIALQALYVCPFVNWVEFILGNQLIEN